MAEAETENTKEFEIKQARVVALATEYAEAKHPRKQPISYFVYDSNQDVPFKNPADPQECLNAYQDVVLDVLVGLLQQNKYDLFENANEIKKSKKFWKKKSSAAKALDYLANANLTKSKVVDAVFDIVQCQGLGHFVDRKAVELLLKKIREGLDSTDLMAEWAAFVANGKSAKNPARFIDFIKNLTDKINVVPEELMPFFGYEAATTIPDRLKVIAPFSEAAKVKFSELNSPKKVEEYVNNYAGLEQEYLSGLALMSLPQPDANNANNKQANPNNRHLINSQLLINTKVLEETDSRKIAAKFKNKLDGITKKINDEQTAIRVDKYLRGLGCIKILRGITAGQTTRTAVQKLMGVVNPVIDAKPVGPDLQNMTKAELARYLPSGYKKALGVSEDFELFSRAFIMSPNGVAADGIENWLKNLKKEGKNEQARKESIASIAILLYYHIMSNGYAGNVGKLKDEFKNNLLISIQSSLEDYFSIAYEQTQGDALPKFGNVEIDKEIQGLEKELLEESFFLQGCSTIVDDFKCREQVKEAKSNMAEMVEAITGYGVNCNALARDNLAIAIDELFAHIMTDKTAEGNELELFRLLSKGDNGEPPTVAQWQQLQETQCRANQDFPGLDTNVGHYSEKQKNAIYRYLQSIFKQVPLLQSSSKPETDQIVDFILEFYKSYRSNKGKAEWNKKDFTSYTLKEYLQEVTSRPELHARVLQDSALSKRVSKLYDISAQQFNAGRNGYHKVFGENGIGEAYAASFNTNIRNGNRSDRVITIIENTDSTEENQNTTKIETINDDGSKSLVKSARSYQVTSANRYDPADVHIYAAVNSPYFMMADNGTSAIHDQEATKKLLKNGFVFRGYHKEYQDGVAYKDMVSIDYKGKQKGAWITFNTGRVSPDGKGFTSILDSEGEHNSKVNLVQIKFTDAELKTLRDAIKPQGYLRNQISFRDFQALWTEIAANSVKNSKEVDRETILNQLKEERTNQIENIKQQNKNIADYKPEDDPEVKRLEGEIKILDALYNSANCVKTSLEYLTGIQRNDNGKDKAKVNVLLARILPQMQEIVYNLLTSDLMALNLEEEKKQEIPQEIIVNPIKTDARLVNPNIIVQSLNPKEKSAGKKPQVIVRD